MPPPVHVQHARSAALLYTGVLLLLVWLSWQARQRSPDVVVYGGTPQGVTAAIVASRRGLRVILIEPSPQLGGVLTRAWLATLDDTNDLRGHPLYGGLYSEFYRAFGANRSVDVMRVAAVLQSRLRQSGVDVWLNTRLVSVQGTGHHLQAMQVQHGFGQHRFSASTFIDASDTADLAARVGAPFTVGRQDSGLGRQQMAATLVFRLGNVTWTHVEQALAKEQRQFHSVVGYDRWGAYGFGHLAAQYRPSDPHRFKLRGLNIARQRDRTLLVNALLVAGVDGTDARQRDASYRAATLEVPRVVAFLRQAEPQAFGQATLVGVAPELYLRESRHLVGLTRLHADDVLTGVFPPDSVATGGYALDGQVYDPREQPYLLGQPLPYGVPLGTLIPRGFPNLLVVSQAASFDSAAAYSARVVPLQMTLGEVAGTAAWLAIRRGISVEQLAQEPRAVAELQRVLHRAGFRTLAPTSMAVHVSLQDAQPAQLLRRGLFNTPTYRRGSLDSAQPILARDFVANLEHWLSAHGKWSTRSAALLALRGWTNRDSEAPLSWAGARAVFALLHEDRWEVLNTPRLLTRTQAAHLLIDMFPAAERK